MLKAVTKLLLNLMLQQSTTAVYSVAEKNLSQGKVKARKQNESHRAKPGSKTRRQRHDAKIINK